MSETTSIQEYAISDDVRWGLIQRKVQERSVLKAFSLFRNLGIEPILIKGWAAARFYPASIPRISIDIDLAVSSRDFDRAARLSASASADGLAIDLHNELRHLDTVEWQDLFDNSEIIHVDGGVFRVLRPEDHLRVLCVHWLNDGGINKDRLWDIFYLIENRTSDFDWHRFLGSVSERRQQWLTCAVGLAGRYLGLNLNGTPLQNATGSLPKWLVRTVENEWASETKPMPLETVLEDRKMLLEQFRKRLRPNPIRATIEMEGSFDARTRLFYNSVASLKRIIPTCKRVAATISRSRVKKPSD